MEANESSKEPSNASRKGSDAHGEPQQAEGERPPSLMHGWTLALLTIALMAIAFVLALDNTILATAIPQITSDFNSLNDIGWYGSSFLIAQMALLPPSGRLYTFFNIKWVYCLSLLVFELGSVVAALAKNSISLIIGRAVTGMGAAGLVSGSTIIMASCIELKKQAIITPTVLGMYSLGTAIGPLVGGSITDNKSLTWRFVFWINLPIGFIALILVWFTIRQLPPPTKADMPLLRKAYELDLPGVILLFGSTIALNLALQWGGIVYPWSTPKVFGCLIGFGLLVVAFLIWQKQRKESSTIPLHIFKNRTVSAAFCFMTLVQMAIVLQSYYWPIYFQSARGDTAERSGIKVLPLILTNSVSTILAGWINNKTGHYVPLMWIGSALLAAGGGAFESVYPNTSTAHWVGVQILSGVGYGSCGQLSFLAVQVVLDKVDIPSAVVMVMFAQMLGGTLSLSIGQNLFTDDLAKSLSRIPDIDSAAVLAAGGKDFRKLVSGNQLEAVVDAFGAALRRTFWVALAAPALAFVCSFAMEWRKLGDAKSKSETEPGVQELSEK